MTRIILHLCVVCILYTQSSFGEEYTKELIEASRCTSLLNHFESKYAIPKNLLKAITLQESGRYFGKNNFVPWPWAINVEGKGYFFETKTAAVRFVKNTLLSGKRSIDVGCGQVNLKHHPEAFSSIEEALDPETNLEYSAKLLKSHFERLGNWKTAIAHYHSADARFGTKYQMSVSKIAGNMHHYADTTYATHNKNNRNYAKYKKLYSKNYKSLFAHLPKKRISSNIMVVSPTTTHSQ